MHGGGVGYSCLLHDVSFGIAAANTRRLKYKTVSSTSTIEFLYAFFPCNDIKEGGLQPRR